MDSVLHMGGYAFYVWTAYALAVVVLAMNWIVPRRALRARWQALLRRARPQATVREVSGKEVSV